MPAGVDASGAKSKAARMMEAIRAAGDSAAIAVGPELLKVATMRAPTEDEEYNELNAEAGGVALVPRGAGGSADTDGRVRFSKPDNTYLKQAIQRPENLQHLAQNDHHTVQVGNRAFLELATRFTYINKMAGGAPSAPNVVGPYFMAFEAGSAALVVPRHDREGGGTYPLRPGIEVKGSSDGAVASMEKAIAPRNMFSEVFLSEKAKEVINTVLADAGPASKA